VSRLSLNLGKYGLKAIVPNQDVAAFWVDIHNTQGCCKSVHVSINHQNYIFKMRLNLIANCYCFAPGCCNLLVSSPRCCKPKKVGNHCLKVK